MDLPDPRREKITAHLRRSPPRVAIGAVRRRSARSSDDRAPSLVERPEVDARDASGRGSRAWRRSDQHRGIHNKRPTPRRAARAEAGALGGGP
jgi:hypothetical protein